MKGKAGWIVAGALAYLAWLVMLAPVAPLAAALEQAGVRLVQPAGGLWSGRAMALQVQGVTLRQFQWDLEASRLLLGRLQFAVEFRDGDSAAVSKAGVGLTGTPFVSGLSGQLAAARLQPFLPIPVELQGRLVLDEVGFRLDEGLPQRAEGLLLWNDAGMETPVSLPLGTIEAVLSDGDHGIRADLSGDGPRLTLSGWAELAAGREYVVQLDFIPGDREVRSWLSTVAESVGGGRYRFRYEDSL